MVRWQVRSRSVRFAESRRVDEGDLQLGKLPDSIAIYRPLRGQLRTRNGLFLSQFGRSEQL
jgi:hypothetical protein